MNGGSEMHMTELLISRGIVHLVEGRSCNIGAGVWMKPRSRC